MLSPSQHTRGETSKSKPEEYHNAKTTPLTNDGQCSSASESNPSLSSHTSSDGRSSIDSTNSVVDTLSAGVRLRSNSSTGHEVRPTTENKLQHELSVPLTDGTSHLFVAGTLGAPPSPIYPANIMPARRSSRSSKRATVNTGERTRKSRSLSNSSSHNRNAKPPLRRGKWTREEEEYVARVIKDFNRGFLRAPAGTTLRTYLSDKLHCDPMRITKKFTGDACIGKRVFHPAVRCATNSAAIEKAQKEVDDLEKRWRKRLEEQQRDSSRKANRSSSSKTPKVSEESSETSPPSVTPISDTPLTPQVSRECEHGDDVVTLAADWLDRANSILATRHRLAGEGKRLSVEHQMKQVQDLIHEVPSIQQGPSSSVPRNFNHSLEEQQTCNPLSTSTFAKEDGKLETPLSPCFASEPRHAIPFHKYLVKSKSDTTLSKPPYHDVIKDSDLITAAKRKVELERSNEPFVAQEYNAAMSVDYQERASKKNEDSKKVKNATLRADSDDVSESDVADVEALVGFLNCVRKESLEGRVDT